MFGLRLGQEMISNVNLQPHGVKLMLLAVSSMLKIVIFLNIERSNFFSIFWLPSQIRQCRALPPVVGHARPLAIAGDVVHDGTTCAG